MAVGGLGERRGSDVSTGGMSAIVVGGRLVSVGDVSMGGIRGFESPGEYDVVRG